MNEYTEGQQVRFVGEFTRQDPADPTQRIAADPNVISFYLRLETDADPLYSFVYLADAPLQKQAVGIYFVDRVLTPGVWLWRFEGTGNVQAPAEGRVRIRRSPTLG